MNFEITPTVKNLLIANFGFYILALVLASQAGIDINHYLGLHSYFSEHFKPYQFITYMFMHSYVENGQVYFAHILSNMFALFMFGPLLERFWGGKRFLFFYLFTGFGAGISYWLVNSYEMYQLQEAALHYIQHASPDEFTKFMKEFNSSLYQGAVIDEIDKFYNDPNNPNYIASTKNHVRQVFLERVNVGMVGASGSVYGILMAFGLLFPNTEMMILFIPFPIKAKFIVGFYALMEIYLHIKQAPDDNVAHFAHLAGMVFAFILVRYWNKRRDRFY